MGRMARRRWHARMRGRMMSGTWMGRHRTRRRRGIGPSRRRRCARGQTHHGTAMRVRRRRRRRWRWSFHYKCNIAAFREQKVLFSVLSRSMSVGRCLFLLACFFVFNFQLTRAAQQDMPVPMQRPSCQWIQRWRDGSFNRPNKFGKRFDSKKLPTLDIDKGALGLVALEKSTYL